MGQLLLAEIGRDDEIEMSGKRNRSLAVAGRAVPGSPDMTTAPGQELVQFLRIVRPIACVSPGDSGKVVVFHPPDVCAPAVVRAPLHRPAARNTHGMTNPEPVTARKRRNILRETMRAPRADYLRMLDGWTSCGMEMQNARHAPHLSAAEKLIATPDQSTAPGSKVTASILQRVAAGDRAAVKECLDTYGDLVWSLARRFNTAHADAEDAVQDIFIDIWTHAGRFDPSKASETTFVATITRRRLIDRLRKLCRRPFHDNFDDTVLPADLDRSLKPDTGVELYIVAQAMASLRTEQQEVLQLSVVEGFSHSAVAERLSMPLGTVKTHVRRGLIRIREELEMSETEDGALT